jgi:hypothetical protein
MKKVFIAGSRRLSRLNADVKRRIDTMIEKDFTILVADTNGADKAVQRYLAEKGCRNVIIHCMANNCRNNAADWPTREILPPKGARGFAYYAAKDQAMVDDAAYRLMLWDGASKGHVEQRDQHDSPRTLSSTSRRRGHFKTFVRPMTSWTCLATVIERVSSGSNVNLASIRTRNPSATKSAIRRRSGDQSGSPIRRSGSRSDVSCRDSPVKRLVAHKLAWLPLSET